MDNQCQLTIASRFHLELSMLLEAADLSEDVARAPWEFAVEITSLLSSGASTERLRWLICKGYVDHRHEVARNHSKIRTFRGSTSLRFMPSSCFMLTAPGLAMARDEETSHAHLRENGHPNRIDNGKTQTEILCHWDPDRRELKVGDTVVKRFRLIAKNQEAILNVLQEESWPPRIDDPLPPIRGRDSKKRLHAAINSLNRHQQHPLIHFSGDGSGNGICWEMVPE